MTTDVKTVDASRGVDRRTIIKAAAWSAPVVAVAATMPLAAASVVFDSPTAYVTGTLTATGTNATVRTAVYSGGAMTYNSAGAPGLNSGAITLTFTNNRSAQFTIANLQSVVNAYVAAGWTVVGTPTQGVFIFEHAPISNGATVTMPSITWSAPVGSNKPLLTIGVSSDSDDVSGQGLSLV